MNVIIDTNILVAVFLIGNKHSLGVDGSKDKGELLFPKREEKTPESPRYQGCFQGDISKYCFIVPVLMSSTKIAVL